MTTTYPLTSRRLADLARAALSLVEHDDWSVRRAAITQRRAAVRYLTRRFGDDAASRSPIVAALDWVIAGRPDGPARWYQPLLNLIQQG